MCCKTVLDTLLPAKRLLGCMQAQDKVAVPYANGILELAQERENLDEVHKDLMTLQVQHPPG